MWFLMWMFWLLLCELYFCRGSVDICRNGTYVKRFLSTYVYGNGKIFQVNLAFQRPTKISSKSVYGPERAVDNNTLGTFEHYGQNKGLGTCCHTNAGAASPEVYWEVDLGNVSIITRIVIQYRYNFPHRLNAYIIEVSDQSLGNGTKCYRDTAPGNPPTYATHDCIVIGRYVRYENNVCCAELCNFETYGCPVNYYGDHCTLPCPSNCLTTPCNPDNGTCIGRCQPGYKGSQCYEGCENGTFGSNCVYQCYCRRDPCNTSTGVCSGGCQKGFQGVSCNQTCTSGQFGYDCLAQCNCFETECDDVNGRCVSGICLPGWTLQSCSQKCQSQTFGHNCGEHCGNCRDGVTCDHVTGTCDNGCADGWIGLHCNISCSPGMYGLNCSKECGQCFNTSCNYVDGQCDKCDYGYRGMKCNSKCPPKTYDVDCSQTCGRCVNDSCSVVNGTCLQGCLPGFGNSLCTEPLVRNAPQTEGSQVLVPVVVTCLVVLAILAVIVVMFIRRKRRKPNTKHLRYMKTVTESKTDLSDDGKLGTINKSSEVLYANSPNTTSVYANSSSILSVSDNLDIESEDNLEYSADDLQSEAIYSNDVEINISTNTAISIKEFTEVVATKKRERIFEEEFKQLPVGLQFPHEHGKNPRNKVKNRFLSTFPYDKNRVILPTFKGVKNSEYINASYIDGLDRAKAYIATQGPKKGTMLDFWRMIWKENVYKIVMVTNLIEGPKTKCEKYWPDMGNSLLSGPLVITNTRETHYAAFIKRKLNVTSKKSDKVHIVYQYHFTQWPDHGTPDPIQLVHFNSRIQIQKTEPTAPILVHCSAGIGRTGTFIGLHELMKHGRRAESINIYQYARLMREGRMNMIQTLEQYICLHDALREGLTNPGTTYLRGEFSEKRESLFSDDKPKNETELWKQYELLRSMTPIYDESCYTEALSDKNLHKNRNTDVLAHNKFRTYLMSFPSDSTNYINAVPIPSYISLSGYITTQIPLPHTVEDFWSMVYDHDCYCVVVLDSLPEDVLLLPSVNDSMQLKSFGLCNEREFPRNKHITDYDIILHPQGGSEEEGRKIKIYTIKSDTTMSTELFVSLCECVIDHQKSIPEHGHIVMTCSDGASRCGIFAALITTVERMLMDNDIDIFQAVRTIQQRRPQFVSSFEQYEYIHQLVDTYIDCNQLYVNI